MKLANTYNHCVQRISFVAMMLNRHILSGFLVLFIIALAYYYRHDVLSTLYDVRIGWTIAGLVCILTNYFFRALRLNILTGKKLSVWPQGIYCTSMHGFTNYMLPLRSGDLSLPFLLKSTIQMELKDGAKVLYKARLLEIFTLGIWLTTAAIVPYSKLPSSVTVTMFSLGLLMILTPFFLQQISRLSYFPSVKLFRVVKNFVRTGKMSLREVMLTFAIWASIAACTACIAASMQLPITPVEVVFLIAIQLAMQLMPIQGFANSGNHESGWVSALMLMGCPGDLALKFAFTSHAIILIYVLFLGLIALVVRHTFIR